MGVMVYVEDSDGVVYGVGEDMSLARVHDGVALNCGVYADG